MRFLSVFVLAACSSASSPPPRAPVIAQRPYTLEVPSTYERGTPLPLVVVLPGFHTDGHEQDEYFKLGRVALAHGALLALVTGTRNADGIPFWNATDGCCDLYGAAPDDVAYLDAVLDDIAARYTVDRKRVWLVGHSNGGFMAHRYACDRAPRVAAFVSLAGANWQDATRCAPSEPVAALQIHGDGDVVIRYEGGIFPDAATQERWRAKGLKLPAEPKTRPHPGARASLEPWRVRDGCDATEDTSAPPLDLDAKLAGAETAVSRWHCRAGAVELWTIHGGTHVPELTESWPEQVYTWLAGHPKP